MVLWVTSGPESPAAAGGGADQYSAGSEAQPSQVDPAVEEQTTLAEPGGALLSRGVPSPGRQVCRLLDITYRR